VPPGGEVSVTTSAERRLAVEHWLLGTVSDRAKVRQEWDTHGVGLLRCGTLFCAVRIDRPVVHAAAGTAEHAGVARFLADALLGGPVFVDQGAERYYVLVGPSVGRRKEWERPRDDALFLGIDNFLGVPHPRATNPQDGRSYWCVEMDGPGDLAPAEALMQLVEVGRYRLAHSQGQSGG
jgi:hypothetical protein